MPKYLITGGAGFIGSLVSERLLRDNHDVRIFDNFSSDNCRLNPDAEIVVGDIRDTETLARAMRGIDGVVHLAARSTASIPAVQWQEHHRINLGGSVNVFSAALSAANGPLPVVYASSAAVYGTASCGEERETGAVAPASPYGADKLGCELHAKSAAACYGLPSMGVRIFNAFGPRQSFSSPYSGVIARFCDCLRRRAPVVVHGDGMQSRDFVFGEDVADAIALALGQLHDGAHVINVCTGVETSVLALAQTIAAVLGAPLNLRFGPARLGDVRRSTGDPGRAAQMLGFKARTTLRDGLAAMFESATEHARAAE